MTEIPEHLLKRAEEAKAKAAAKKAEAAGGGDAPAGAESTAADAGDSKIPAHLLERSRAAKERAEGGGGVATAAPPQTGVAVPNGPAVQMPVGTAGNTQRLLTVVKAGSIQDVKATPVDKVHTWPHL